MFERALNVFWILLGAAAASYAWTLGLVGTSGPESGLFPFLAGLIIMGAGVAAVAVVERRFRCARRKPLWLRHIGRVGAGRAGCGLGEAPYSQGWSETRVCQTVLIFPMGARARQHSARGDMAHVP
jgi:hypothetical protein